MSTSERHLRSLGLSSASLEVLSPAARATITRLAERAAQELCSAGYLGGATGVAVNLLGDETQLNAALAGPLRALAESSGLLDKLRVVPLAETICAHAIASADGYLDLADPSDGKAELEARLAGSSGGGLAGYAAVAVVVEGVRVGTLCLYGTELGVAERRDGREAGLRRYGALLSRQLEEAARLTAENRSIRDELAGASPGAVGDDGIYADREQAAAWRETNAILGDVERSIVASGPAGDVVACVVEVREGAGRVAIVATSEGGVARYGVRPSVLRQVGDEDLLGFWRGVLSAPASEDGAPSVHQEDALTTAVAAARLGTAPGAFASMTAASLPRSASEPGVVRGLVVLCGQAPSEEREGIARSALVGRLAGVVGEAQRVALAVFNAPAHVPAPAREAGEGATDPEPEMLSRVRQAFGAMKLRALLALAEERGVDGAEDATGVEDLLRLLASHASREARARRSHLETLSLRELLAVGAAGGIAEVEEAETKREMIEALLAGEGLLTPAPSAPLPPLPVPPRASLSLTGEQAVLRFDPGAAWVKESLERADEALPYSLPGGWSAPTIPRPPVPPNEAARNEAIERLGLGAMRDFSSDELVTFDGIAAGAAAVAGAMFGAVTLVAAEEQIILGMTSRAQMQPLLLGDSPAQPRATAVCQYVVAKGGPMSVVDMASPEAGPIEAMTRGELEMMPPGFDEGPRSYLGVPMVTTEGVILGNVCVIDGQPRPDFAENPRLVEQLEALAAAVVNLFELRRLRRENAELHARRQLDVAAVQPLRRAGEAPPVDRLALLMTDIEGSTELHERDPALTKRGLEVHDAVMRRAIADNGGVEVSTEGDAFTVAFHTAADAIRCAFDAQLRLLSAPWPPGLDGLSTSTATDAARSLSGLRVRMTVHHTESGGGLLGKRRFEISRNSVTRRPQYRGPFVDEARYVSEMASGGQIVVTQEAFDEVALALTTALGDPRVMDLGRYEDEALGDLGHVYELTPRALAARTFTPPVRVPATARLTSPGYIHAPRTTPLVVMFVLPVGLSQLQLRSDAVFARGLEAYTGAVRSSLAAHGGYEMRESEGAFMCAFAFEDAARALAFGADVHARVAEATDGALRCRVGIHGGEVAIEPHLRTGRLEAFGPACNRAARLAKACNPGQTLVDESTTALSDAAGVEVALFDLGAHRFKGLDEAMRVLQIGEGFHPPIHSLGYGAELVEFGASPAGNVTRARATLGAMDAMGVDALPLASGAELTRAQASALLQSGLAERASAAARSRVAPAAAS